MKAVVIFAMECEHDREFSNRLPDVVILWLFLTDHQCARIRKKCTRIDWSEFFEKNFFFCLNYLTLFIDVNLKHFQTEESGNTEFFLLKVNSWIFGLNFDIEKAFFERKRRQTLKKIPYLLSKYLTEQFVFIITSTDIWSNIILT